MSNIYSLTKKVAFAACPFPSGGERGRKLIINRFMYGRFANALISNSLNENSHFKTSSLIKFFYFKISCTFVAYSLKLNSNE